MSMSKTSWALRYSHLTSKTMKYLSLYLLVIIVFSCTQKENDSSEKDFNFSYSVDTVIVDAGDDFIFLKYGLNVADITPDNRRLFNFNPTNSELEIIDLESLTLTEKIQMEKEGPNGTGNPSKLHISNQGKFFFLTFLDIREFDPSLESLETYKIRKEKFDGLEEDESLSHDITLSPDGKFAYIPYGPDNIENAEKGLGIIELENQKLKKVPMEIYGRIHAFESSFYQDGKLQSRSIESTLIDPIDHRVLISSPNFNEVYVLDRETDSISHKIFHSNLTSDSKKVPEITSLETPEEMRAAFQSTNEQVHFSRFYYDDFHERFWRFSRDLDHKIGDSAIFKEVVTLFDKDLNQIHEELFPINYFGFKFFKDGKLYSYINVEDELGFAVFTFDF